MYKIIIIVWMFCCSSSIYYASLEESSPKIKQFPYNVEWDNLKQFSYFPQGFYTFCKKPYKYPLITGPCSPCCGLFLSDPNTQYTLGFHIGANNSLTSLTDIIDDYFPAENSAKRSLKIILFTHSHTILHKHVVFKEGTHKDRFLTIFNTLNAKYHLVNQCLYFNDTNTDDFPRDRWVIYYGSNKEHKPKICRVSSFTKGGIDFERYNCTIHAEQFGSIKAVNKFLEWTANEPLYKTKQHSLTHIKSLCHINILPLKDGVVLQAFLPNSYHLQMPLLITRLSDSWITTDTSFQIAGRLEKFIEDNKKQFTLEQNMNVITTVFKDEIVSYFTKTDAGYVLKPS